MSREVVIVGGGIARYGRRRDASFRDLAMEAIKETFESVDNITPKDIQALYVATGQPERLVVQSQPATLIAEYAGITPKYGTVRVEMACTSGTAAIRLAYATVKSGMADIVLVVGVEKMYSAPGPDIQTSLSIVADKEWEGVYGMNAPPGYAFIAQRHMYEYGTTEEQMAMVAVKNHKYGAMNPKAQFQKVITIEDVFKSPVIAPPIKLYDCSPITDGAAAAIITSADIARKFTDTPIYILATAQVVMGNTIANIPSLTTWVPLREAAKLAYRMAKVEPKDIDVAETHDCFTISEIIEYEDLGFTEKGKGGKFIEEGQSEIGGKVPVNVSGGLKAKGHPVGATGIGQAVEIMHQLRGEAGKRQVDGAEIGLAHNLSGFSVNHFVTIYGREPR